MRAWSAVVRGRTRPVSMVPCSMRAVSSMIRMQSTTRPPGNPFCELRHSAADGAHRASGLDEARLVDVMLELLAPDGLAHYVLEVRVGRSGADRPTQVGLVEREQAGAQLAVGGEPDAVAVAAERLGHRVDEADRAAAVGEAVDAGGCVRLARRGLE